MNKLRMYCAIRKSAASMAVLKLVVGPIIGVIWTTRVMNKSGLIDPEDKMLQFIMIFTAGGLAFDTYPDNDG